jgi:hypothetical protein
MPPKTPPDKLDINNKKYTGVDNAGEILKEISLMPSTIETIDTAMFRYIDEVLNLHTNTNEGFRKVPVIWVSAERAFQIKNSDNIRGPNGRLTHPIIALERTGIQKDPTFKGVAWSHIPNFNDEKGGAIVIARRIKQDKTANFTNADKKRTVATLTSGPGPGQENFPGASKKVVYETISIPMPTYIAVNYSISIKTNYQEQMNNLITPFMVKPGQITSFFINTDGHKFEGFIEGDFAQDYNAKNLGEEERTYKTEISTKVQGYLIGAATNEERPKIAIRENAVDIKIGREQIILGEIPEYNKTSFYKP